MAVNLKSCILASAAAAAVLLMAQPACAQTKALNVPSQPATTGVADFARQADVQVLISGADARGRRTNAVVGSFDIEQGLERLLQGTGLVARRTGPQTYTIMPREPVAEPQSTPEEDNTQVSGLTVTGTLIRGAVPAGAHLTVLDARAIRQTGQTTLTDVMQTVSQNFRGNAQENTFLANQGGSSGAGFSLGTSLNLRGVGADATLTLLNGRRLAPAGYGDFVDVSAIPLSAVDHIEILADGASATYGSDAMAGVVNIFMKQSFSGLETEGHYGVGDGLHEWRVSALAGKSWATGHVLGSYEYYERSALAAADRPYTASADLRPFGGADYRTAYAFPGNIISPSYLAGALPAGSGLNLQPGDILKGQTNLFDDHAGGEILPRQERHSLFVSGEQALGPRVTAYADGLFSYRRSDFRLPTVAAQLIVPSTNYYRQHSGLAGSDPIVIEYNLTNDLGATNVIGDTRAYAVDAGFKVDLSGGWRLNLYGAAGENRDYTTQPYFDTYRVGNALDRALASSDPATAFNPFGSGGGSPKSVIDSLKAPYFDKAVSQYQSVDAILDGALFHLPGGAVKIAVGGEVRHESFDTNYRIDWQTGAPSASTRAGEREATAAFAELFVPLVGEANGRLGLRRLEVSASARYDHYSDFGSTTNPKVGATWSPFDGFSIQGSWGRSFKAPRLNDLLNPQSAQLYPLPAAYGGPDTNHDGYSTLLLMQGGNPNLKPERGEAWTIGVRATPRQLPGFSASVTYFNLAFTDRIAQLPSLLSPFLTPASYLGSVYFLNPSQAQVDALLASVPRVIDSLPSDTPVEAIVDLRVANVSQVNLDGLDFAVSQVFNTRAGEFTASASFTYYLGYTSRFSPTAPAVKVYDTIGYPVSLRGRAGVAWRRGSLGASIFANYQSGYVNNAVTPHVPVSSQTTFDLQVSYDLDGVSAPLGVTRGMRMTLSVNNLFNTDPPLAEYDGYGYDAHNYSPVGRLVAINIAKRW
ncbi:TonB-dependent receptor [Caulobacter sp. KR2-114]|uniref:TonB-dependent receptor n=1 Tax=Caulobacter sp. KR2-114 TaxID=3400912 RepID=UPI003C080DED